MIGEQGRRQSVQTGLEGDLRLGAALLLVRQIQILETLLGVRGFNRGAQRRGELALFLDALKNGRTPLVHLAQINQPLLQIAQLRIVEAAGGFLAIARNERHRGASIQQCDRRGHLRHGGREFQRDAIFN